ncbi:RAMP superfamily CRISPR-associated protein [Kosmotoga olearia]|uniref:CRISPR type III-associated protein domain-containing protein n=1 Tax=Kosmotoga olearia (strain ATCC BAA-1733 / DSM 21960 / TBF 19.5.1) TaxID=521045 RepID=C5CFA5_KOSOT|nr:RAMP superfamily CRISPR-associated protein [Kosmotoga olearia]ACR79382.1 protein of unknown function DUF324 [Kosmotoga olearia TBF 19.5.1]
MILDYNSQSIFEIQGKGIIRELTKEFKNEQPDGKKIIEVLNKLSNSELTVVFKYFETQENSDGGNYVRKVYKGRKKSEDINDNRLSKEFYLKIDEEILKILPPYSFIIEFEFTLEKPYISKDDENFTIIENSIKREKVLGCPYIPGSTWKGCLRSALWQEGMKENNKQIIRIFGNERQEKDSFRQGRLHFFPTFFSKCSFEIINPHDRKTRTGTMPILIECVPIGEKGKFSLLYVPFDLIGKEQEEIKNQTLEDLKLIVKGLKAMFTVYGFGAKTSSGYGLASNIIENGKVYTDISIKIEKETEAIKLPKNFRKYLNENGTVRSELVDSETGELLSNNRFQEKKGELGFQSGNEFSQFKRWYKEKGEAYRNQLNVKDSPKNMCEFNSFDELIDMLKKYML